MLALVLAVSSVHAETLELKTGEVLIGRVLRVDDRVVEMEVGFPEEKTVTIAQEDMTPGSLYTILAAHSNPASAQAHLSLAETSLRLGLRGHAIAEYREAARLDPTLRESVETKVSGIRRELAADLLLEARIASEEARWAAALLTLNVVLDRFADTPSAKEAARLLAEVKREIRATKAGSRVSAEKLDKAIREAERHEKKAEEVGQGASGYIGLTIKEQKRREKVIANLEKAWNALKDIAPPEREAHDFERFTSVRERIRGKLGQHYLALGTAFLKRRAINSAEDYNIKACELDTESGECHKLQDLIVQARIISGGGGGVF